MAFFAERIRGFLPHLRYEGPQVCCAARVTMEVADGISRRENPQQIAERLKRIEGVQAGVDELRDALLMDQVLSELVSVNRLNEIVADATRKISLVQGVIGDLRGAETILEVDRILARKGGIEALGFSRVAVYEITEGKVKSQKQWIIKEGKIEEEPYRDSFFAEGREPMPGEAMDEVVKTGKPVLIMNPSEDPRCQVRPAQNKGTFALIPGNGSFIYMFDTLAAGRTIHEEDIKLLESLVKVGVQTKHRIKSEQQAKIQLVRQRTHELVAGKATEPSDLMRILLIAITFNYHLNLAAIFMKVANTNRFKGVFGLGSLTEKEHIAALRNLSGVRTEEDVWGVVKNQRSVDPGLNQLISSLCFEGELSDTVIVRGSRFYHPTGQEYESPPPAAQYLLSVAKLPAEEFVIFPIKTGKTVYGFLYLANPWSGRDIDFEGIRALGRDFIDLLRVMRRSSEPPPAPGQLNPQQLRVVLSAFSDTSDPIKAAKDLLASTRAEVPELSGEQAEIPGLSGEQILNGMIKTWQRRLGIPDSAIRLETNNIGPLSGKDWISAVLGAGIIEASFGMGIKFDQETPFGDNDWIKIMLDGEVITFEIAEEKMRRGIGFQMLRLLGEELKNRREGLIVPSIDRAKLTVHLHNL